MQLFLPGYGDLQALRTAKAADTEKRARELIATIGEERERLRELEVEMELLRERIKRKRNDLGMTDTEAVVATARSRLASLSPSVHRSSRAQSPVSRATSRLNASVDEGHGRLFQSMYTKDYFPKKNFGGGVKIYGRPKDKVWEYREQLLKNQHVIRGLHK